MSVQPSFEPECSTIDDTVELLIEPRSRDLGGFSVRRVLPARVRRMVGPFIFFDEMGPVVFAPGQGLDVRPHPHIGIATITYLLDGEIMHRDSLGFVQPIQPGAVNLMTAGRGIVHSERTRPERTAESTLHGIQSWIALPDGAEEMEPAFAHFSADSVPEVAVGGAAVRVIIGAAYGARSPVPSYSPTLYLEAHLPTGARLSLPEGVSERAAFIVSGALQIDRQHYDAGVMAVFRGGRPVVLHASATSRIMILGGEPVGERTIWWNFVSSSRGRIEQAKHDWREGRFDRVEGDDEFIPLPGE